MTTLERLVEMIISLRMPFGEKVIPIIEERIGEKIHAYQDVSEAAAVLPKTEIMMLMGDIDGETIKTCRHLKWIFSFSAGVEKLPFAVLTEMGVKVNNTRGIHGSQIA